MNKEIILNKSKLYQLAFVSLDSQIEDISFNALVLGSGKANELGADHIMTFDVQEIEHGDIEADLVLLIEWPSLEHFEKYQSQALIETDFHTGFSELNMVVFNVEKDTNISFDPGGLYEFAGFWMNRHKAQLMPQYFEKMGPVVKLAQPEPLVEIDIVRTASPFDLKPSKFNFLTWRGGSQARAQMFESEEFKQNGYLRALALDRLMTVMVSPK